MNRRNSSRSARIYLYRRTKFLIFFCYSIVWIPSAITTLASGSASLLSPESDDQLVANVTSKDNEQKQKGVIDAAKRLIRRSLRAEDISRVLAQNNDEKESVDSGPGSSAVEDDLSIVLGQSFDQSEIESMIQDVKNELKSSGLGLNSEEKDTVPSIHSECMASPLLAPSTAKLSAGKDNDDSIDIDYRMTGDRHASGLLDSVQDPNCLEREFDVQNDELFDIQEAINVLVRCRILVLRNVFSKETTNRVLPRYVRYISDVQSGKISEDGTTTFGGDYFILKEDNSRFNYMATKELVEASTGLLDNDILINILSDAKILGDSVIVNHVGTIDAQPGAEAQYWHKDGDYVPNDDVESLGYAGVGGHDLAPFAINMFTPLRPHDGMTLEHGPTEFCVGTSYLKGHDMEGDLPLKDPTLLNANNGIVERLQEFEWYIEQGMEPPPHVDCPNHLYRIPLLQEGDALLFDYMLTHRGGANNSAKSNRSMIFATYSKKWFRDTNFDSNFGHRTDLTRLEELIRLTRFAVVNEATTATESRNNDGNNRFPRGTGIYKVFGNEEYTGKVVGYDNNAKTYEILYEDGDEERMSHEEVRNHLNPR